MSGKTYVPAVDLGSLVGATAHYLRRSVQRRPAEGVQQRLPVEDVGEAEVGDLGAALLVQQDVFQLQVPVADVVLQKGGKDKLKLNTIMSDVRKSVLCTAN